MLFRRLLVTVRDESLKCLPIDRAPIDPGCLKLIDNGVGIELIWRVPGVYDENGLDILRAWPKFQTFGQIPVHDSLRVVDR